MLKLETWLSNEPVPFLVARLRGCLYFFKRGHGITVISIWWLLVYFHFDWSNPCNIEVPQRMVSIETRLATPPGAVQLVRFVGPRFSFAELVAKEPRCSADWWFMSFYPPCLAGIPSCLDLKYSYSWIWSRHDEISGRWPHRFKGFGIGIHLYIYIYNTYIIYITYIFITYIYI